MDVADVISTRIVSLSLLRAALDDESCAAEIRFHYVPGAGAMEAWVADYFGQKATLTVAHDLSERNSASASS